MTNFKRNMLGDLVWFIDNFESNQSITYVVILLGSSYKFYFTLFIIN